ncbi:hypothetical protein V8C86DRAFT_320403 [Haematococcus lacustris]
MASFSLPSYPPVLPFPDPLLHCGTVPLDLLNDKNKGLRGAKGSGWSQPAELSSLAFQRQLLTSWLSSPDKAHVSSDDLARLDALVGRMVSLAEEAGPVPGFRSQWSSPLTAAGPPKGLVGHLMGAVAAVGSNASAAAATAAAVASAAAAAASGAPPPKNFLDLSQGKKEGVSVSGLLMQPDGGVDLVAVGGPGGLGQAAQKTMWRADCLQQEAAMWCFTMAAAMRQHALEQQLQGSSLADSQAASARQDNPPAGSSAAQQELPEGVQAMSLGPTTPTTSSATNAVTLLRQAAGLFAHLASRLLPLLPLAAMAGGQQASKVPAIELLPSVARALEATCLAEGQALTIARAREKGVSAATEAGLEAGCAELFSRAALALQAPVSAGGAAAPDSAQGGVPAAAARLSAYLSVSKAWHTGRARMAQLQGAVLAGELGQATALGQAASSSLGDAAKTAAGHGGDPGWLLCVQQLRSQLGTALAAVEKDRLYVTLQVARAGSRGQEWRRG